MSICDRPVGRRKSRGAKNSRIVGLLGRGDCGSFGVDFAYLPHLAKGAKDGTLEDPHRSRRPGSSVFGRGRQELGRSPVRQFRPGLGNAAHGDRRRGSGRASGAFGKDVGRGVAASGGDGGRSSETVSRLSAVRPRSDGGRGGASHPGDTSGRGRMARTQDLLPSLSAVFFSLKTRVWGSIARATVRGFSASWCTRGPTSRRSSRRGNGWPC